MKPLSRRALVAALLCSCCRTQPVLGGGVLLDSGAATSDWPPRAAFVSSRLSACRFGGTVRFLAHAAHTVALMFGTIPGISGVLNWRLLLGAGVFRLCVVVAMFGEVFLIVWVVFAWFVCVGWRLGRRPERLWWRPSLTRHCIRNASTSYEPPYEPTCVSPWVSSCMRGAHPSYTSPSSSSRPSSGARPLPAPSSQDR
jgi:hypothetical protein